jgi:uncharacterized protein YbaR (Trm112 family)
MTLDPRLLAILCDPIDHGPLRYVPSANLLINPRTSEAYEILDGIVSLVPGEGRHLAVDELATMLAAEGTDTATR